MLVVKETKRLKASLRVEERAYPLHVIIDDDFPDQPTWEKDYHRNWERERAEQLPLFEKKFKKTDVPGRKVSRMSKLAEDRQYSPDMMEWMVEWDKAQREKGRPLSKCEVLQVALRLGYRKPEKKG